MWHDQTCTVGTADQADDNSSPAEERMQTTVTTDSPVTDGVLKLLFKKIINRKAAKTYRMCQETKPQTVTSVVTIPTW